MDNSLIVDGLNISELSDDDLLERLHSLGFNAGPITGSTRGVYERKLARLLRNEDFDDLAGGDNQVDSNDDDEEDIVASPVPPESSTSFTSSYSASPSLNIDDLRRRPLSRVEGQNWSSSPTNVTPQKPWSIDDIVTQAQPGPEEEEKTLVSNTTIAIVLLAILLFGLLVFYNMESVPPTPLS